MTTLEQLQPLIAPQAIGLWPPAPGWWLLAVLMLLMLLAATWSWRRRRRLQRQRRQLLSELLGATRARR